MIRGQAGMTPEFEDPAIVAKSWEKWCGQCAWTKYLRRFGELGGTIQWWCGYPRSASAIPLTFAIKGPDDNEFYCDSRLKDIKAAIVALESA